MANNLPFELALPLVLALYLLDEVFANVSGVFCHCLLLAVKLKLDGLGLNDQLLKFGL